MNPVKKRRVENPFKSLYEEAGLLPIIQRSLTFILLSNLCGNLSGIVCNPSTTATVGLATQIGANDLAFGILTGLANVFSLLQIPFSILVNRTHKRKFYLCTFCLASRALWMLVGLIPYIIPNTGSLQLYVLYLITGLVSIGNSMVNVCWFPWLSDLCPKTIQSRWMANRDMLINGANIIGGIVFAILLDMLPESSRYVVTFLLAGALSTLDLFCYAFAKEEYSAPPQKLKLSKVLNDIRKDKRFVHFTLMWTAWSFCWNISGNFITPYMMNEMELGFTQIMIFGTITAAVAGMFLVSRWGKAVFHYGSRTVMIVSCVGASVPQLFFLFSSKGSVIPLFLFNLVGAAFWCGCNMTQSALLSSLSPDDKRPSYVAVYSCVTSLIGVVLAPVLGGALLDWWERSGWFTGWFDRYKMLFLIAFILRITSTVYMTTRLQNENNKTPKDLIENILHFRRVRVRR